MPVKKVVVAFSGGKDSTAAILLLKKQGCDVQALTMKCGVAGEEERFPRLEKLSRLLEVPLDIVDLQKEFHQQVVDYFIRAYATGFTPNPCIVCNHEIKFKVLLQYALSRFSANNYATGHYASKVVINGRPFLTEPADRHKSQIYFLSMIGPAVLEKILFPLDRYHLSEIREMVKGLPLGNPRQSQDVCFIPNKDIILFLHQHLPKLFQAGDILDVQGNIIGAHQGVIHFTLGQRRGTGFSSDRKRYVVAKDVMKNTITLGDENDLMALCVVIDQPVFWTELKAGDPCKIRIRYAGPLTDGVVGEISEKRLAVQLNKPIRAVTPGQVAVLYEEDRIIAAGFIISGF